MIKLIFCLRRLPTLSVEEFQDYWRDTHAPLVSSVKHLLRATRYTQSHLVTNDLLMRADVSRGTLDSPFDGVAEFWWDSTDVLKEVAGSREAREAGRMLLEDERNFIDLPRSPIFYSREHEIYTL